MPLDRRFGNATWTGRWVRRLLGQLLRRVPRVRLFLRSREGSSYPGPRTSTSRSVRPAGCTRRGGAWPSYGPSRPGGSATFNVSGPTFRSGNELILTGSAIILLFSDSAPPGPGILATNGRGTIDANQDFNFETFKGHSRDVCQQLS
jgi:hypothetical protein